MAHCEKYKITAVAPMVAHYERSREGVLNRENIDHTRTNLNYNLRPGGDVCERVQQAVHTHEQEAGKAVRKDANVMFDWVVTLPQDCPQERTEEFFESVVSFVEQRYGKDNILGAYVHMDETTPHVHVPVVPMMDGRLRASKMVNRNDLLRFHGELSEHVEQELGIHVSVELSEEKAQEKALSSVPQKQLDAAREALKKELAEETERLEYLRQRAREIGEEVDAMRDTYTSIQSLERKRGSEYRTACREIVARCDSTTAKINRGIEQLRERIDAIRQRIKEIRQKAMQSFSLNTRKRQAQEVSQGIYQQNRSRGRNAGVER